MSRVWILSDTHIGCRSNSVMWLDIIEDYFFNFFIPLVKENYRKGDVLIHTGDVFDNRQSLNLAAQHLGIRVFEELSKIFPEIHIIVGNHDIMRKNSNEISSVDCLKYIPNVHVYKEPKVLTVPTSSVTRKLLLMPWRKNSEHERESMDQFTDKIDYLFCHTETPGVQLGPSRYHLNEHGNDKSIFDRFEKVYSGHIHYRQELGNFILVGNPYQMTRSDRDNQKGIYVLDIESGEHTFYENNHSPIFIKHYLHEITNHRLNELVDMYTDNFVDIHIPSKILGNYNINRFMEYLDGHARRLEPKIYDDELHSDLDEDQINFEGQLNILKVSNDFIHSLDYDDDLKERLMKSIKSLYDEILNPTYEDTKS